MTCKPCAGAAVAQESVRAELDSDKRFRERCWVGGCVGAWVPQTSTANESGLDVLLLRDKCGWLAPYDGNNYHSSTDATLAYPQVWVSVANGIAYVHSDFYNGAASTAQCEKLTAAIRDVARSSGDGGDCDVKAVLLMGGEHSYGNGINLNTIEASDDPEMVREGERNKRIKLYRTVFHPHFDEESSTLSQAKFTWHTLFPSCTPYAAVGLGKQLS